MDSPRPSPFPALDRLGGKGFVVGGHTKGQVPKTQLKKGLLDSKECAISSPAVFR